MNTSRDVKREGPTFSKIQKQGGLRPGGAQEAFVRHHRASSVGFSVLVESALERGVVVRVLCKPCQPKAPAITEGRRGHSDAQVSALRPGRC